VVIGFLCHIHNPTPIVSKIDPAAEISFSILEVGFNKQYTHLQNTLPANVANLAPPPKINVLPGPGRLRTARGEAAKKWWHDDRLMCWRMGGSSAIRVLGHWHRRTRGGGEGRLGLILGGTLFYVRGPFETLVVVLSKIKVP
jgi:hypothetical protein